MGRGTGYNLSHKASLARNNSNNKQYITFEEFKGIVQKEHQEFNEKLFESSKTKFMTIFGKEELAESLAESIKEAGDKISTSRGKLLQSRAAYPANEKMFYTETDSTGEYGISVQQAKDQLSFIDKTEKDFLKTTRKNLELSGFSENTIREFCDTPYNTNELRYPEVLRESINPYISEHPEILQKLSPAQLVFNDAMNKEFFSRFLYDGDILEEFQEEDLQEYFQHTIKTFEEARKTKDFFAGLQKLIITPPDHNVDLASEKDFEETLDLYANRKKVSEQLSESSQITADYYGRIF